MDDDIFLLRIFVECLSFLIFLTEPPKSNAYFNEIYKLLVSFVGGDKSMVRKNHVTPYGYRVSNTFTMSNILL